MENHPEAFEEAKRYEKTAVENGSPFTWTQEESLEALSMPKRVAQIKKEHQKRLKHLEKRKPLNPLRTDMEPIDIDDIYGKAKVCLNCHK